MHNPNCECSHAYANTLHPRIVILTQQGSNKLFKKKKTHCETTSIEWRDNSDYNEDNEGLFSSGDRLLLSTGRADGENPEVSWEKKQFHIDNAATTELHLAFADKSVPVTKEFSTPQAICAVH